MDFALMGAIVIACCFAAGVFSDGSDGRRDPAGGRADGEDGSSAGTRAEGNREDRHA